MPSRVLDPPIPRSLELEVLCVWVRPCFLPKEVFSIIFGVVYYPSKATFRKTLVNYLEHTVDHFRTNMASAGNMIRGHFNDIRPSWLESRLSLKQVVMSPTRRSNLLQMVFTSLEQYYKEPEIKTSIGLSDYLTVIWRLSHLPRRKAIKKTANRSLALRKKITLQNWTLIYRLPPAEDMTDAFCDQLQKIFEKNFPEEETGSKK